MIRVAINEAQKEALRCASALVGEAFEDGRLIKVGERYWCCGVFDVVVSGPYGDARRSTSGLKTRMPGWTERSQSFSSANDIANGAVFTWHNGRWPVRTSGRDKEPVEADWDALRADIVQLASSAMKPERYLGRTEHDQQRAVALGVALRAVLDSAELAEVFGENAPTPQPFPMLDSRERRVADFVSETAALGELRRQAVDLGLAGHAPVGL